MTDQKATQTPMRGLNVLILSASSKVRLVERFKAAGQKYGSKVFVSDLEQHFAAQYFADGTVSLPRTNAPEFEEALIAQIRARDIGLIVPTRDGELPKISELAERLEKITGVRVLISPFSAVSLSQDKKQFLAAVAEIGMLGTPCLRVDEVSEDDFPLFTRPRLGAGSVGARRLESLEELGNTAFDPDAMLLHPFIDLPEYSADCLFDFEGNGLQGIIRERQVVSAGESKQTTVVDAPQVLDACIKLGTHLKLRGHVIFQLFWNGSSPPIFIEVNPRFGGASDLSMEAGLASVDRLMALCFGTEADKKQARKPHQIRVGLMMLRYSRDVFVEQNDHE